MSLKLRKRLADSFVKSATAPQFVSSNFLQLKFSLKHPNRSICVSLHKVYDFKRPQNFLETQETTIDHFIVACLVTWPWIGSEAGVTLF